MRIGVFGAGAIGCWVGVKLAGDGASVTLVGRRVLEAAGDDLSAVDLKGRVAKRSPMLTLATDAAALANVDVCLVAVKSQDTAAAAETLRKVLKSKAIVVSLQNGLRNVPVLREVFGERVVAGMVTFNVRRDGGAFRQATDGPIMLDDRIDVRPLELALRSAGVDVKLVRDMDAVQATKLLLNLNNGLCAATGMGIAASLQSRTLRRCYAALLVEGVEVLRAAGRNVTRIGPLSPPLIAKLLPLPDAIFSLLAARMIRIDPAARSSTLQDLDAGKPTEIDDLNGEIVRLAASVGRRAPLNEAIVAEVKRLEGAPRPLVFRPIRDVWSGLYR